MHSLDAYLEAEFGKSGTLSLFAFEVSFSVCFCQNYFFQSVLNSHRCPDRQ